VASEEKIEEVGSEEKPEAEDDAGASEECVPRRSLGTRETRGWSGRYSLKRANSRNAVLLHRSRQLQIAYATVEAVAANSSCGKSTSSGSIGGASSKCRSRASSPVSYSTRAVQFSTQSPVLQ